MWPFKSKSGAGNGLGDVRERLSALEEAFSALRRDMRDLMLEGQSVYEKTLRLHERMRKRASKATDDVEEPPEVDLNEQIKAGLGVKALGSRAERAQHLLWGDHDGSIGRSS